jgi:uncharacterized caspase-like protein
MRRTIAASRSVLSGHGDIDERSLSPNTLIAYAQKAGVTAEDGEGANSPYTTALLKHLLTPGLDVELALRRVRDEVLKATQNRQEPFKYGSLGGAELPLVPGKAADQPPVAVAPPPATSEAVQGWALVQNSEDVAALEAYRKQYGPANPFYDQLAASRIAMLNKATEAKRVADEVAAAEAKRKEEAQHLAMLAAEARQKRKDEDRINLSMSELRTKYGNVEQEGSKWIVAKGVAALSSGYNREQFMNYKGINLPGQHSSLEGCKSLCLADGNCRAFFWSGGFVLGGSTCHLFRSQAIDTVTSEAGIMEFKQ